ncbi:MAG: hypothetical protein HKN76_18100 [Saprospiraceae bacterium]|nr:hypothetical protein [Saprospiraceae bacterium]
MVYALADVLSVDPNACSIELSQDMVMGNDGFATTFMYTEDHIKNSLIPQLQQIRDLYIAQESDSAEIYRNQISVWQQVVDNNRRNKQKAKLLENRSFSAGASYLSSTTIQSQAIATIETSAFIDAGVVVGAGFEVAGSGVNGFVETRLSIELGASITGSSLQAVTTGFELNDDDQGDFFSVNIKEDPVYGTPVFDVVSGRSSCPREAFTQPRESLQLQADAYAQFDIPADGRAVFRLDLGNISQSDEPRTYLLKFLQESNPDGAVVTIGGSQAQAPIPYTIPAGGKRSATITVERGARAFNYNNLQFVLTSGCEDDLIADTVNLSVSFESVYPAINIIKPNLTWIATQQDADLVLSRFSGFDLALLKKVQLQYAPAGTFAWEVGKEWLPSQLEGFAGDFTDTWEVDNIPDGTYDIRYRADYGDGDMYSEIHSGTIDRQGPQILGLPEPSDNELVLGDVISINFNENISCFDLSASDVTMINTATEATYPVQLGCAGNKLIIQPLWNLSAHIGEEIKIELRGITDKFGNQSVDSMFTWSFRVGQGTGLEDNDPDQDGVENLFDNCSIAANPQQADLDGDGIGDICDDDMDGDGIINIMDNCAGLASEDQSDIDADGIGDLCDDDMDGDGILNSQDNCPMVSNPDQADGDQDNEGDVCDDMATYTRDLRNAVQKIQVFPNPANFSTAVKHKSSIDGKYQLIISDLRGQQMQMLQYDQSTCFQDCTLKLDVSNLVAGSYFITISDGMQLWHGKLNVVR